jgi:hypothetical protein
VGTTTSKSTAFERLARGLSLTRHGREALDAATAEEARLEERRTARAALEAATADEAQLPALEERMRAAEAKYAEGTERLALELHAAQTAYAGAAQSTWHRRSRAENTLRFTADPLLRENGFVVAALVSAIGRVRPYLAGADEARGLLATESRMPIKSTEQAAFAAARTRVRLADRASEILPALEDALEQVRALQLQVEVDPGAVRELLETCPERDPDGEPLHIIQALADVPAPSTR